jgi:argininosuccinate lyase
MRQLLAGTVAGIEIDVEALRQKAAGCGITMTEVADTLVRLEGLGAKKAHRLVAHTVARLLGPDAAPDLVVDTLAIVASEVLGRELRTTRAQLCAALCLDGHRSGWNHINL